MRFSTSIILAYIAAVSALALPAELDARTPTQVYRIPTRRDTNATASSPTPTNEGACTGGVGGTCATGLCCSQFGFCGVGPAYCGMPMSMDPKPMPSAKPTGTADVPAVKRQEEEDDDDDDEDEEEEDSEN